MALETAAPSAPAELRTEPTARSIRWLDDMDHRRQLAWIGALVIAVVLAGLLPLIWTPRFYFYGDTQAGAMGQWYFLGRELLAGHWPLMEPQVWRGGNFVAEGQAGLFSPLTMLIAVLSTVAGNLVAFVTVVKLTLLVCGAIGTFLLTRSYDAPSWAAFVAGLTVTVGGTTRYLESPSWVTGQMIWALLPLFWWCLRRMLRYGANPAGALVSGFLIVTVGYVYGCFYIALVVLACLVDALLARQRSRAIAVVLVGLACGLMAVTVYLPGVLTAPVTIRTGIGIVSEGRLSGEPLAMAIGFLALPSAASFIAWFIPVLAWLDARKVAELRRSLAGLIVLVVLVALWILGPNQIGPIRWPLRVMPELVLPVAVGIAVLLGRARQVPLTGSRLLWSIGWVVAGGWLAASRVWSSVEAVAIAVLLVAVGLTGIWWLLRLGDRDWRGVRLPATGLVAAAMALWTLVVVGAQYHHLPSPPSVDRHLPTRAADYRGQAAGAVGDTIVVGDAEAALVADPQLSREILVANSWYLNPVAVQATYTTTSYAAYSRRYCLRYNGYSCPSLLKRLFSTEPVTGRVRADLLALSSVLIYKPSVKASDVADPPSGWHLGPQTSATALWIRDEPVPSAGGVAWTDSRTSVTELGRDARTVRLRVDDVGPDGGTVVLSRIAWPGYQVSGAAMTTPTDDYLLTVTVPPGARGQEISLRFQPPGWTMERVTLVAALLVLLGWSGGHRLWRLRRSGRRSPDPGAG